MCASRQMPEEAELNFINYLKKQEASPNTVKSCLASCRLYYSLFDGLNMTNLMQYKDYLLNHYKAATVNNRIYGINRYWTVLYSPRTTVQTPTVSCPSAFRQSRHNRFLSWMT